MKLEAGVRIELTIGVLQTRLCRASAPQTFQRTNGAQRTDAAVG